MIVSKYVMYSTNLINWDNSENKLDNDETTYIVGP
jgi:hypothetical protein